MSNIFVKRVAKMLDGMPSNGYSESYKPIRAPINARRVPRKGVPSEFELHTQVLHNTWGRIEFEIEPLNQALADKVNGTDKQKGEEIDYKVKVKTHYRMKPILNDAQVVQSVTDTKYNLQADESSQKNISNKAEVILKSNLVSPVPPPPRQPLKAISAEEVLNLRQDQQKLSCVTSTSATPLGKQSDSANIGKNMVETQVVASLMSNSDEEINEQHKVDREKKYQHAKKIIRKEFACRESRKMLTLINERKAHAAILQEKSVFANFAIPVLETLAKSPQTPRNSLKWLAFHENPTIRKAVAKNRNSDLEILGILARDENEGIRLAVVENPLVDKEFLLKLLNDDTATVVQRAQDMLDEMTRSQAVSRNRETLAALNQYVDLEPLESQSDIRHK